MARFDTCEPELTPDLIADGADTDPALCSHPWYHFDQCTRRWCCYSCETGMRLVERGPDQFPLCIFDEVSSETQVGSLRWIGALPPAPRCAETPDIFTVEPRG